MDEKEVCEFFAKDTVTVYRFPNTQLFDLEGLIGRWRSTSYALLPEQDNYQAAIAHLTALFEQYQCDGKLEFVYQCKAYLGGLDK